METFLIKALQLILSLSILVIVHEFGHFLFARIFKIRVEKFYLFFNPGFSLFKYKPKNSDTEYGIGWLPLGGYVKIAGMIDESMDKEQLKQPPQPWEFRTKPAWQRLLVMVGGVLFNLILAAFIYAMMLFSWGDNYIPYKNITTGMEFSEQVKEGGFRDGDILISADGKELQERSGILNTNTIMQFVNAQSVMVERDGKIIEINPPADFGEKVIFSKKVPYEPIVFANLDSVMPNSEAARIGLQKGDSITGINGKSITTFGQIRKELANHLNSTIDLSYYRNGEEYTSKANIDESGIIGFSPNIPNFEIEHKTFGFFQSFPAGIDFGIQTLKGYIAQFKYVFTKEGISNLGGFGAIGSLFAPTWNWEHFWMLTAFLSIILAVMNILPVPGLDGGHVMFLLYEVITRRKPNEKFMEYAQIAGMILLFALILYANGNDIFRFLF